MSLLHGGVIANVSQVRSCLPLNELEVECCCSSDYESQFERATPATDKNSKLFLFEEVAHIEWVLLVIMNLGFFDKTCHLLKDFIVLVHHKYLIHLVENFLVLLVFRQFRGRRALLLFIQCRLSLRLD